MGKKEKTFEKFFNTFNRRYENKEKHKSILLV